MLSIAYGLGRSSSVGRAMYCRAGGGGFDSVGRWRAITQGRKITKEEGISFALQTARYLGGSDDHALYKRGALWSM